MLPVAVTVIAPSELPQPLVTDGTALMVNPVPVAVTVAGCDFSQPAASLANTVYVPADKPLKIPDDW